MEVESAGCVYTSSAYLDYAVCKCVGYTNRPEANYRPNHSC